MQAAPEAEVTEFGGDRYQRLQPAITPSPGPVEFKDAYWKVFDTQRAHHQARDLAPRGQWWNGPGLLGPSSGHQYEYL
jgi:hypothetical protein